MISPELLNWTFSIGAVLLQASFVGLVIAGLFFRNEAYGVVGLIRTNVLKIVLVLSGAGVVGSLLYSEVVGYAPCSLCWWARIFMYPMTLIALVALWKKRDDAVAYLLPMSVIGTFITAYNSYLQYGGSPLIPCDVGGVDCAQRFVFEFGYITIPLMAFTLFLCMTFVLLLSQKKSA